MGCLFSYKDLQPKDYQYVIININLLHSLITSINNSNIDHSNTDYKLINSYIPPRWSINIPTHKNSKSNNIYSFRHAPNFNVEREFINYYTINELIKKYKHKKTLKININEIIFNKIIKLYNKINIYNGEEVIGDRKSTRLNSSHSQQSRMPSSA